MLIRHSLMQFATPCSREKFTCTFVGTGRNVRYAFSIYCRYCSRGGTFPGTIAGGNYCWEHMDHHMNLEERVVAAEVASRRADGPGVIEVQSQLRSDVAGQGLGPGTQWRGRPVVTRPP